MKTINKFILALFVTLGVSCSKDDDENDQPVIPVTMEFVNDLSFLELSEGQEVQISFDRPAPVAGSIIIEVIPADASGFTTTPAIVDGGIQLQVAKGATGASFSFDPVNDDELQGNREINFVLIEDSENFLVGEKSSMEVTIFEDESAATAGFEWSNYEIMENQTEGFELPISFTVPVPGQATLKVKVEGESVGDYLATVPAMNANNVIEVNVPSGVWDVKIGLQPKNNNAVGKNHNIKFKIIEVSGPINKGDKAELNLLLKDDDILGKLKMIETDNGSSKTLETFEYDSQGRIIKVLSETNASGNVLVQNYQYDENGQLTSISGIAGNYEAFTWENGKIVKSETVVGFMGVSQSLYEYQNGKLSRRRDFALDSNRNATETGRYTYTWHSDGNLKSKVHTSLVNGEWKEIYTRIYDSYSELEDPSQPGATPYLFPQQQLYFTLTIKESNNTRNLAYTHFLTEGKLIERYRSDYKEKIIYSYY